MENVICTKIKQFLSIWVGAGCFCHLSKALRSDILIEIHLTKSVNTGKIKALSSHAAPWLVGAQPRRGSLVTCALLMGTQAQQQDLMTCHKSIPGQSSPLNPKIPGCCSSLLSLKASGCWTYWFCPASNTMSLETAIKQRNNLGRKR